MKKFELGKDWLILAILTLLTVFTWIGFNVYYALTKTTIPQATKQQMQKLNPNLDTSTFEDIKARMALPEEELNKTPQVNIQEPQEQATESGQQNQDNDNL